MGDRFDRLGVRHVNVESLLRRPLAGIGHNGGPVFDMSWGAWVWRRASAKAWKTPKPEVALRRLKSAERLGLTYREFTGALMDSGAHLGCAVIALSLAARLRRAAGGGFVVEPRAAVAAKLARFSGRLFVLADIDAVPAATTDERPALVDAIRTAFAGRVEAAGFGHDVATLRALLRDHNAPRGETFMVVSGLPQRVLAESAGLPLAKDIESWFA